MTKIEQQMQGLEDQEDTLGHTFHGNPIINQHVISR
jgi:hypothetical protein